MQIKILNDKQEEIRKKIRGWNNSTAGNQTESAPVGFG